MKSLKQIQEEELKKFDKEFPIIQLHDPNIPFFAKDLKLEVRKFLLSAMEASAMDAINALELQSRGYSDEMARDVKHIIVGWNDAMSNTATKAKDYLGDTHD